MGRYRVGIELDIVARSIPTIHGIRQQVLYLEGMVLIEPQRAEIQMNPAGVAMVRTQIDDNQNNVGPICRALAIAD